MTHLIENAHRRPVLIANNSAFEVLKLPWPPVAQLIMAVLLRATLAPTATKKNRTGEPRPHPDFIFAQVAQPIPCPKRSRGVAVCLSAGLLPRAAGRDRAESRNRIKQIARAMVRPFALMARSAVLDFAERSRRRKIFCGDRRSVELRALCNDSPRTPPGPEGSNGNGSASCAAEYPKFLSSHPEPVEAHRKAG
jgi:hypothetical protein